MSLYGEFDPVTGAGILGALDAAACPPAAAGADTGARAAGDGSPHDGAATSCPRWETTRGRQLADGLARVCADWLGGGSDRPARPLLTVHVDLSDVSTRPDGTVELDVRGGLPRVTAATVERLARDADLRAVLFDGARPLAVSAKTRAAAIPTRTRDAVSARDRGCRFPGSADPAGHADLHHLLPRARGGGHHPDNLVMLGRYHRLAHRHGWTIRLDPATGQITAQRGRRRWRSLPRGTPLPPPERPASPPHNHGADRYPTRESGTPPGDEDGRPLPF